MSIFTCSQAITCFVDEVTLCTEHAHYEKPMIDEVYNIPVEKMFEMLFTESDFYNELQTRRGSKGQIGLSSSNILLVTLKICFFQKCYGYIIIVLYFFRKQIDTLYSYTMSYFSKLCGMKILISKVLYVSFYVSQGL